MDHSHSAHQSAGLLQVRGLRRAPSAPLLERFAMPHLLWGPCHVWTLVSARVPLSSHLIKTVAS